MVKVLIAADRSPTPGCVYIISFITLKDNGLQNVRARDTTTAVRTTKWNWNKTVTKLFWNCFVLAMTKHQDSRETC